MNAESVVERVPGLAATPVDTEMVFLSSTSDSYIAIDAVGRRVWEGLERPVRFGELVDSMASEFDGPRSSIEADIAVFLGEMQREGMIRVVEHPAG